MTGYDNWKTADPEFYAEEPESEDDEEEEFLAWLCTNHRLGYAVMELVSGCAVCEGLGW